MTIFLTGATGFVGSTILHHLTAQGHHIRCLVRAPEKQYQEDANTLVTRCPGDVLSPRSLEDAMAGCEAVIHLVGIIREFPRRGIRFQRLHVEATRNILAAATKAGIRRYLHMSANGEGPAEATSYLGTKRQAEELVHHNGLDWTIFRPSLIYGQGGEFTRMLATQIRLAPLVPVIGSGNYRLSPVHVDDIASAFVSALDRPASLGKTYCCCGPENYSYNELIDVFAAGLGKKPARKLHVPAPLLRTAAQLFQGCPLFPVTTEQISLLLRGNSCTDDSWIKELDIKRTPTAEGIKKALT
ncbi:MAG: complex I NDUFA9 subunit family protein [Desulfuromonadaceae bacterium]|nr:complex I NDUFA9 subunit family protein [Desulfuromonadaceae bacterium]